MFIKLKVPVLGIIENMAYLDTPDGMRLHPFGKVAVKFCFQVYQVPYLEIFPYTKEFDWEGILVCQALSSDGLSIPFEHIATERTSLFSEDI